MPEFIGACNITCFPSIAPIACGKSHFFSNSCAIASHSSSELGTCSNRKYILDVGFFFQEPGTSHSAETSGFENQNEELAVEGITPSRTPEAPRRKRARTDPRCASAGAKEENQTMLLKAFEILKSSVTTPTDPYFTYGQHIANELRKYDPSTLA